MFSHYSMPVENHCNFLNIRVTLCKFRRNTENKNEKKQFPVPYKFKFDKVCPIH